MTNILKARRFKSQKQYKPGDILIPNKEILARIKVIAVDIAKNYKGKNLLVIGLLKGAYRTTAALVEQLHIAGITDIDVDFMRVQNYGSETTASGKPKLLQDMYQNPKGRHLLVVDDILETGESLDLALSLLDKRKPASVSSFVLLEKEGTRKVSFSTTYRGFLIPKVWVQGFGMDSKEVGRGDPNIIVGPHNYQK